MGRFLGRLGSTLFWGRLEGRFRGRFERIFRRRGSKWGWRRRNFAFIFGRCVPKLQEDGALPKQFIVKSLKEERRQKGFKFGGMFPLK